MSSTSSIPEDIAVWGDELLEMGDPLGHVIALARQPDDRLVEAQRKYHQIYFSDSRLNVLWKNGVIDTIRGRTAQGKKAATEISACPGLRFLRVLELTIESKDPAEDPVAIFVEHGLPPSLAELKLSLAPGVADFRRLYSMLPKLERLAVSRPGVVGVPELPSLRSLELDGFKSPDLEALARGSLPSLETVGLAGVQWREAEKFGLPNSPSVRRLDVWRPKDLFGPAWNEENVLDEFRALLESPIAAQTKELEFHELMKPIFFRVLVSNAHLLERFEWIRIQALTRDADLKAELKKRLGSRIHYLWED